MSKKKKKYQPKMTAEEYEDWTGQGLGKLTDQSTSNINGVIRPTNG